MLIKMQKKEEKWGGNLINDPPLGMTLHKCDYVARNSEAMPTLQPYECCE